MPWLLAIALFGKADPQQAGLQLGPPERISIEMSLRCTATANTHVKMLIPQPQSDDSTRIEKLTLGNAWARTSTWSSEAGGNRWWVVTRDLQAGRDVEFAYRAEVVTRSARFELDIEPAAADLPARRLSAKEAKHYLTLTEHTGRDWKELPALVQSLNPQPPVPRVHTVRRVYEAVLARLDYDAKVDFLGAELAWQRRVGQCCDYGALMVALCRACGVPARTVAGFKFYDNNWRLHVWVECFFDGLGWAPFDPTMGDYGPKSAKRFFGATDGRRVAVTRDLDLDIDLGRGTDASLVQEYLYSYRSKQPPKFEFKLQGQLMEQSTRAPAAPPKGGAR